MASPVPQKDDVERWTVEQVSAWLQQMELTDCCESFLRRGIDGRSLMELTEEGLVLWGRDVSIRNRKKIMKLVRQIENQHLISTGRQQPSQIHPHGRHLPPLNSHASSNLGHEAPNGGSYEHDDEDDDGFDTDEFDEDYPDQDADYMPNDEPPAYRDRSPDCSSDDGYLVPKDLSAFPKPAVPCKSSDLPPPPPPRQPIVPPERRGPMPLPTENSGPVLLQKQKMPFMPTQPDVSRRSKPLTDISEPPRRPPPTPNTSPQSMGHPMLRPAVTIPSGMAPLKPVQRGEWTNKLSETSSNQNGSQPKPSFEGGMKGRPGLRPFQKGFPQNEGTDNEYEVVETPPGSRGNECHNARPPRSTTSPNQEPPPLPERNPDGQGSLQHTSAITGGPLQNRPLPANCPPPHRPKPTPNEVQAPSIPQSRKPHLPTPPPERAPSIPQPNPPASLPSNNQAMALPLAAESVNIGDGESIELTDLYRKLLERSFFHMISRDKSNRLLRSATDGVFLIRPSTRSRDPLTLSLQYNGRTYNINIRRRNDGYFALGTEKVNEITFQSVDDLVSCYTKDSIKLQSGARIRLTKSPEKVDHIYVKLPLSTRMK